MAGGVALITAALLDDQHKADAHGAGIEGKEDMFGGILINAKTLPTSAILFDAELQVVL
jgi:hypothetical protein